MRPIRILERFPIQLNRQALQGLGFAEGWLRHLPIVILARCAQRRPMVDPISIFVFAVFLFAGFIKGAIGLGLPSISMGLLALVMPPAQAAAILIAPALAANVWQAFA